MIFYEDDDYLIINKPKDIAVHKAEQIIKKVLQNYLI